MVREGQEWGPRADGLCGCDGWVFLAVLLLIFETTNDYVRFHGESLRPCSTTLVASARLTCCSYHLVFANPHSLSVGSIDDTDHRLVVIHDPHRDMEVVTVSLCSPLGSSPQIEAKLIPPSPAFQPPLPLQLHPRRPLHCLPSVPGPDIGCEFALGWRSGRDVDDGLFA